MHGLCSWGGGGDVLMLEAVDQAWVNGEPVKRHPLKSGDEIRLGEQRFVLQAPGLRPPSVLNQTREKTPFPRLDLAACRRRRRPLPAAASWY